MEVRGHRYEVVLEVMGQSLQNHHLVLQNSNSLVEVDPIDFLVLVRYPFEMDQFLSL